MRRPLLSESSVAKPWADTNGFRYARMSRLVCKRKVVVAAAANDKATNGSSEWWPPRLSHLAEGNGWSVTNTAWKPAASALWLTVVMAAAVANSGCAGRRSVGRPREMSIVGA